jgi:hypothetical protein
MSPATNDSAHTSASRFTIATLLLALIVGGYLRCANLGARQMSADEGASWAAAAAPTISEVLRAQNHLNPGKAGLHDVALHLWMRVFGDQLAAMRALSAAIGTIAVALIFGASREILAASCGARDDAVGKRDVAIDGRAYDEVGGVRGDAGGGHRDARGRSDGVEDHDDAGHGDARAGMTADHGETSSHTSPCPGRGRVSVANAGEGSAHTLCSRDRRTAMRDETAALAALIFAVNLIAIKYSREVRMYPFVIAAVVAQTWFFFRAYRRGGLAAYSGVALFTALALAAHLTAILAFSGEGLWLAFLVARNRFNFSSTEVRRALILMLALTAGVAMLAPFAAAVVGSAAHAADRGAIDWIKRPEPWAAFALFNKGTGSFAFPAMALLAAWGILRGWRRCGDAIVFALLWMWTPPLLLMLISYALRPAFVERYLVSSFVPFFLLIAIGIVELPKLSTRCGAVALVVALAIGHVAAWNRKPHDVQWREAARVAATNAVNGSTLGVAPGYAINVVRYYIGANSAVSIAHPVDSSGHDPASVAIIGEQGVAPATASVLAREYPRVLANLRGVVVRGR